MNGGAAVKTSFIGSNFDACSTDCNLVEKQALLAYGRSVDEPIFDNFDLDPLRCCQISGMNPIGRRARSARTG
jgi:hypothetical protein